MVLCPEYPGLELAVCADGKKLYEYDDDEEDATPKTITKYIKARSGSNFEVVAAFLPPFPTCHHVRAHLSIDGVTMAKPFRERETLLDRPMQMSGYRSQQDGEWVTQDFCFSGLNIVEEALGPVPSVAVLKQTLSTKGCITLSFEFIESYQDSGPDIRNIRTFKNRHQRLAALNEIPEKALKGDALSHQTTLSKPQKCQYSPRSHIRYKSLDQGPFATFHFKYRSLASLKALGVIATTEHTPEPLENTPEPLEDTPEPLENTPVEDLTPAELRETLHHVRQREAENTSIKQEARTTASVKRERTIDDEDDVTYLETRQIKRPHTNQAVIVID